MIKLAGLGFSFVAALTFVGSAALAAPPESAYRAARIESIVQRAIADRSIPGAAVAIAVGDEIVYTGSYGVADLATGAPVTAETNFRLGSISKFITALAVMRLVEQGRLRLDAPVAEVLANRPAVRRLPAGITVERLLNHTSGLGELSEEELASILARDGTMTDADGEPVLARSLLHEPGTNWLYSNEGYRLLSWVVEEISGRPFNRYVTEELGPALGLESLRPCDDPPRAQGYVAREARFDADPSYAIRGLLGEGGLCAAADDLVLLAPALVGNRWIGATALQAMVRPTRLPNGAMADYGLGVRRGMVGARTFWGHSGSGLAGGWAALAHYPDDRVTIVVLANGSGGADDAITLQARIAAAYFGSPPLRDEPIGAELSAAIPSAFSGGGATNCLAQGPNGLTRRLLGSEQPPRPLLHQGEGVFAREDYPFDRLIFQVEAGRAVAQRVYYDGFFAELLLPSLGPGC